MWQRQKGYTLAEELRMDVSMMRSLGRIRGKLNSTGGASVVFALFGLMIAAMVSTVVVSAAWLNANRVGNFRDEEQGYLTVSSMANVLTDAIKDTSDRNATPPEAPTFSVSRKQIVINAEIGGEQKTCIFYRDISDANNNFVYKNGARGKNDNKLSWPEPVYRNSNSNSDLDGALRQAVCAMARAVDLGETSVEYKLSASWAPDGKKTLKATIDMVMDENYNLSVAIESSHYSAIVKCGASVVTKTEVKNYRTDFTLDGGEDSDVGVYIAGITDNPDMTITEYVLTWPSEMMSTVKY